MTAHFQVTLHCDAAGCTGAFTGTVNPRSQWDTRSEAYQHGWASSTYPYGYDYCPEHQAEARATIKRHWKDVKKRRNAAQAS